MAREEVELPFIRIEVTVLLAILERLSKETKFEITGKTSDHIFESIEDIKSNLAAFVRAPVIEFGPVEFDTRGNYSTPTLSFKLGELSRKDAEYTVVDARILMKSLEQELIRYKNSLADPSVRLWPARFFLFIATTWIFIGHALSLEVDNEIMVFSFFLLTVIWMILEKSVLRHVFGGNTVFYQPRETWYQRHSSELFVFVGTVGTVVAALASFF